MQNKVEVVGQVTQRLGVESEENAEKGGQRYYVDEDHFESYVVCVLEEPDVDVKDVCGKDHCSKKSGIRCLASICLCGRTKIVFLPLSMANEGLSQGSE